MFFGRVWCSLIGVLLKITFMKFHNFKLSRNNKKLIIFKMWSAYGAAAQGRHSLTVSVSQHFGAENVKSITFLRFFRI